LMRAMGTRTSIETQAITTG